MSGPVNSNLRRAPATSRVDEVRVPSPAAVDAGGAEHVAVRREIARQMPLAGGEGLEPRERERTRTNARGSRKGRGVRANGGEIDRIQAYLPVEVGDALRQHVLRRRLEGADLEISGVVTAAVLGYLDAESQQWLEPEVLPELERAVARGKDRAELRGALSQVARRLIGR